MAIRLQPELTSRARPHPGQTYLRRLLTGPVLLGPEQGGFLGVSSSALEPPVVQITRQAEKLPLTGADILFAFAATFDFQRSSNKRL
jgi:hypothetical protein